MMFDLSIPLLILRIPLLQLFKDAGSKTSVNQVLRVIGYALRPIDLHASPFPAAKTENFLVEVVRESLRPRGELLPQELVEDGLQCLAVTNFLVAGCFIDQRSDTDSCKAANEKVARSDNVFLLLGGFPVIARGEINLTYHREQFRIVTVCSFSPLAAPLSCRRRTENHGNRRLF
jgi:hypothetical protein